MKREKILKGGSSVARRRWSRRDFLKMGGAGLAGATLLGAAGCGGGGGEQGGGPTNIIFSFGPDESGTLQELIDRFNQENQGQIQVEYRQMSEITDEYFRTLVSDFEAGAAPPIDVIGGDVIWGGEFAANGWIEDLSGRIYTDFPVQVPDAFLDAPIDSVAYSNSLYGVPWFTDAGLLFYRRDLLEQSGIGAPPTTWSGLKEIANQVTQDAGTRYGFVFQGAQYEGGVTNFVEYVWNAGGTIVTGNVSVIDPDRPVGTGGDFITINSPQALQGLRTAQSMITDGVTPEEVIDYRERETYETFLGGDAVFMRGWPFMYALAEGNEFPVNPDQIGIAQLPVEEEGMQSWSCLGGWNMYVNAASEKKDAAWEFIKFMTAPEQQKFRALEGSFLPTLRDLYNDPQILNQAPVVELSRTVIEENTRSRPVTSYYSRLSARLARTWNNTLARDVEPQQALENLQAELERISTDYR